MLSPYQLKEIDEYSYGFITDKGNIYSIYFLDYSSVFSDYPKVAERIYSFNIDILEGNANRSGKDERIGITIVEVFRLFFLKSKNVAVYVCDSLDSRQLARKRKFDLWFWKYNDGTIIKEDGIAMIEGVEILNSLLIHKRNPNLTEIILAFKELNDRASEK